MGTIAMIRRRNADPFMHEIVYPTMEPRKLIKLLWPKAIEAYFDQIKTFSRNTCLFFHFVLHDLGHGEMSSYIRKGK